ncbi:MAG TPA: nitrogenase component 1 [Myxococcota bacterium]|nr:nitrogenase component 1 [Myxococcota bacterium]
MRKKPLVIVDKQSLTIPFTGGLYLAVNGIKGSRLIMDGPTCAFYKAEFIQGNHQIVADLQRHASPHRIIHSELDVHRVIVADEALVTSKFDVALSDPETEILFFSAMTFAVIIGRDLERIMGVNTSRPEVPRVLVQPAQLGGDWIGGYGDTLAAIARTIELGGEETGGGDRVGIVGNLFLRHEGDGFADVAELERMVAALGASTSSIWLSGGTLKDLENIADSDLLVALPYGQEAAKILGERLNIPVIYLPLPFSWTHTERFINGLAEALDRPDQAKQFIDLEKRRWAAELLFRAEQDLLGTNWIVIDDPVRMEGWQEIAHDVGAHLLVAGLTTNATGNETVHAMPTLLETVTNEHIDVFVSNSVAANLIRNIPEPKPVLAEFGYPCFGRHPIAPLPSFGFPGALATIEILCQARRAGRK